MQDPSSRPKSALIVAHGQPSDPGPAAAEIAALAALVADLLPGWHVGSATLAEVEALSDAITRAGPQGVVFPLFMAAGWFTRTYLPDRLAAAGGSGWQVLAPFGEIAGVQDLAVALAREAVAASGATALLLAAHGSSRSSAPSDIADAMALRIQQETGLARVEAAFIDQSPQIANARGFGPRALCLPFFAARGGHVTDDLPAALTKAGFQGTVLRPLGLDPRVPALIAGAIARG